MSLLQHFITLQDESGFTASENINPSLDDIVFLCSECNHIEANVDKLKKRFQLGAAVALCCPICDGFQEVVVMIRPKSEVDTFFSTPASPPVASPPVESFAATSVNASAAKSGNPLFVKAEDAVDDDMSAGVEVANIQIRAPSSPRILSQGIPAPSRSEEVLVEIVEKDEENAENQL